MTANQINYWNLQETKRHNSATEQEAGRHNVAQETETHRANVAQEQIDIGKLNESVRHNKATEHQAKLDYYETVRHNYSTEAETIRHNSRTEMIDLGKLNESIRHNQVTEAETKRSNLAIETENRRHNLQTESETERHNVAQEAETSKHNRYTETTDRLRQQADLNIKTQQFLLDTQKAAADRQYKKQSLEETKRSNMAREKENTAHNAVTESETRKHNRETELATTRAREVTSEYNQAMAQLKKAEVKLSGQRFQNERAKVQAEITKMNRDYEIAKKQMTIQAWNQVNNTINTAFNVIKTFTKGGKLK